jgi:antitoxin (DNA-binding transcriptional repressor) of toxin-antitoxin stability system
MKTATVRQVRHDFGTVMQWVADGESVEVSKRGEIIALITPPMPKAAPHRRKRPDFLARFEKSYGKNWRRKVGARNSVVADRQSRSF